MTTTNETKKRTFAELAQEYIGGRSIIHHQGRILLHNGTRYVEETALAHKVRRFLIDKGYPENNHTVSNVVGSVQAIAFIDPLRYPSLPFHFGCEPFPKFVIAYANGLLDVEAYLDGNRELIPHTPDWISTVCLPYKFDAAATSPHWERFLGEVFEDDQQRIAVLQEWFGYCLLPDTSQHKLLVKVGPPRAGKGTTDRVLEALLGKDNTTAFDLHSLADKFGVRRLVGKYVAFVGEVNLQQSRERYLILEKLNSIVGADPQPLERKFVDVAETVVLPTRFNISCNETPFFGDPTGALSARMLILPYNRSFLGHEDRALADRLLSELPGINNWALAGLARLRANKAFSGCGEMAGRVQQFRRDNSDAFAFLQDCMVVDRKLDSGILEGVRMTDDPVSSTAHDLIQAYQNWCQGAGRSTCDGRYLAKNLRAILPKLTDKRIGQHKVTTYFGIGLAKDD